MEIFSFDRALKSLYYRHMLRCEDIQDSFFHDSRPVAGFIRIFDNVSQGNMEGRDIGFDLFEVYFLIKICKYL